MTSNIVAARVNVFSLADSVQGYRTNVFTFDTLNHAQDIREQIHEQVLERDVPPGIYCATISVIGGESAPSLHMYTFEVYEEDVIDCVGGCELPGIGFMLNLDVETERCCRPVDGGFKGEFSCESCE